MAKPSKQSIEKLSPEDRERFEQERADLEDQLNAIKSKDTSAAESLNRGIVEKNLARTTAVLERDEEATARGRQKDVLSREAKILEEELTKAMPTKNQMWPVRMGSVESEEAVRREMQFTTKMGDKARRWQEIQRRLEPEDPHAASLERIRPDR